MDPSESSRVSEANAGAIDEPGLLGWIRANPATVAMVAAFTVAGAVGALWLPLGDFSVAKRVLGGAIAGFYFGLFPIGYRMFD